MSNKTLLSILAAIVVIAAIISTVRFFSAEDAWVCRDGVWIRHGNPAGNQPLESCPQDSGEEPGGPVEVDKGDLIRVNVPAPNQSVGSPIIIEGEARGNWYFEADFPVRLYDSAGQLLATAIATAQGDWMTENFVPFRAILTYQAASEMEATLVLEKDNPSGLPQNADEIRIPLRLQAIPSLMTVKAYFSNIILDPAVSCNVVFPIERQVPATSAVARAALEELIKGLTTVERDQGYSTSLNEDVRIQSLTIENGVAKVDFNPALEAQPGGSCRAAAIGAQIRETLLQFPTVSEVIISIDGRSEDILQP